MNTPQTSPRRGILLHPLVLIAATAVVLFCGVGIAAIMGWIPTALGGRASYTDQTTLADARAAAGFPTPQPGLSQAAPGTHPKAQDLQVPVAGAGSPNMSGAGMSPATVTASPNQPASRADMLPSPGLAAVGMAPDRQLAMAGLAPSQQTAPAGAMQGQALAGAAVPVVTNGQGAACVGCGTVESIHVVNVRAQGTGVGAAGGAVLGGILGHQIGGGNGRSLATVAGAVGGAVVGNQIEGNMKATHRYDIRVRLDDGHIRTFHQQAEPGWQRGDRVKVVNGHLRAPN